MFIREHRQQAAAEAMLNARAVMGRAFLCQLVANLFQEYSCRAQERYSLGDLGSFVSDALQHLLGR